MISLNFRALLSHAINWRILALITGVIATVLIVIFVFTRNPEKLINNTQVLSTQDTQASPHNTVAANVITKPTTDSNVNVNDSSPASSTSAPSPAAVTVKSPAAKPSVSVPIATTVTNTTVNNDSTTTKEVTTTATVPFLIQTLNEVNLQRGVSELAQVGRNGVRTLVYTAVYDQTGKEISRKITSDKVTRQTIDQITKVGISDFNMQEDTFKGTEFGEMCLLDDYDTAGDGCIGTLSSQHFSAVKISDVFYVYCVSTLSGMCAQNATVNQQPVLAMQSSNIVSFNAGIYFADARAGGGESQPLTQAICSQFGLACGIW